MKFSNIGRPVWIIMGILLLTAGVITALALKANNSSNVHFSRKFLNSNLSLITAIPIKDKVLQLVGVYGDNLYFKTDTTGKLLVVNTALTNIKYVRLPYDTTFGNKHSFDYEIVGSTLYFYLPNSHEIVKYDLQKGLLSKYQKLPSTFTRATKLEGDQYLLRGFHPSIMRDQVFYRANERDSSIKMENKVSPMKYDMGMGSDGELKYDPVSKRAFYTEFFQPTFLCIDSGVNLVYKGETIDRSPENIMVVKNQKKEKDETKVYKSTTPKKMINAYSDVQGGYLYILSYMKSDGEGEAFSKNLPVDLYQTSNGMYVGSFHVPNYHGERPRGFKLRKDRIIVFYRSAISSYKSERF